MTERTRILNCLTSVVKNVNVKSSGEQLYWVYQSINPFTVKLAKQNSNQRLSKM